MNPLELGLLLLGNAIIFGCVFALVGMGFNIFYNTTKVLNFAQGDFLMVGGMVVYALTARDLAELVAVIASLCVTVASALLVYVVALAPLRRMGAPMWTQVFMLFAVSTIYQNLVATLITKDAVGFPAFPGPEAVRLGEAQFAGQALWVVGLAGAATLVLDMFYRRTTTGKAMKACAIDAEAAAWVGINVTRVAAISFALSALLSAVAGIAVTPLITTQFNIGLGYTLKGFMAAILGGLGNVRGALLGGLLLGLIEAACRVALPSLWSDPVVFLLLVALLLARPTGIIRGGGVD